MGDIDAILQLTCVSSVVVMTIRDAEKRVCVCLCVEIMNFQASSWDCNVSFPTRNDASRNAFEPRRIETGRAHFPNDFPPMQQRTAVTSVLQNSARLVRAQVGQTNSRAYFPSDQTLTPTTTTMTTANDAVAEGGHE